MRDSFSVKHILFFIGFIFFILFSGFSAFAQCDEPEFPGVDAPAFERKFNLDKKQLVGLNIEAGAKSTSWAKSGAEAAALTIFIDDRYSQDLLLFAGEKTFDYRVILGELDAGKHRVKIIVNRKRSAPGVNPKLVTVRKLTPLMLENSASEDEAFALANAPFIYARPNTVDKFSDIPLITYFEIFKEADGARKIRYTTIFTNEDGGTQTAALMARWGRLTDIEWVYEITEKDGKTLPGIYQGASHQTKTFYGKRIYGNHPVIFDVTDNNNFSDAGCSPLRFAPLPVRADLATHSRENVMDQNPWTYRIMVEEARREGRIDPAIPGDNIIADPRDYLYVEIETGLKNAAIDLEIENERGEKSSSGGGNPSMRVNRNGFVRIALFAPVNVWELFPELISIRCHDAEPGATSQEKNCELLDVIKIARLKSNYELKELKIKSGPKSAKAGESAKFNLRQ